jgi:hypothetical protein
MYIFKVSLLLFTLTIPNMLFAQNPINIFGYIGKRIITVLEYHKVSTDSTETKYNGIDTLINNTEKMQWETLLKINENKLIEANRKLKRMQIAYLDQPRFFFDSENPVKFSGILSVINQISDRLVNKDFKEDVPVTTGDNNGKRFFLYNISPYDTTKYISTLFFLQKVPLVNKENDKWSDTLIKEKAILLNVFTVKSISKNNLTLYFRSSAVSLNDGRDNKNYSNDNSVRLNIFENSIITEGHMNIDPDTHFIYSIQATTARKMESSINEVNKKNNTVKSNFTLFNRIE